MSKRKIVTQVGSLPYDDVDKAVEYSLRHDIPFLPELPKLGDAMLEISARTDELDNGTLIDNADSIAYAEASAPAR